MKVEILSKIYDFNEGISLLEISKKIYNEDYKKYICAIVNNKLRELNFEIFENSKIEFLDLKNRDAMYIYQSTLRYIISYAFYELFPEARIKFNYSISRSIFCQPIGLNHKLDVKLIHKIDEKIRDIIEADLPISKEEVSTSKAKEIFSDSGLKSKVNLLEFRKEKTINIYKMNDYYNYMFNYLAPSTGFISNFRIHLYSPGFIIQYPRHEAEGEIPDFVNEVVMGKYLKDQNKWGQITNASYVSDLNKIISENNEKELINICETRHNNMLAELSEQISNNIENIKLIAVAGPSSSGKTTFTNRLRIALLSKGIKPLMISLDNYYKTPEEDKPKNDDGTFDLEHIEALNLELFDEQMVDLINGEKVTLPIYNFKTGKREVGETVCIEKNQPILIEGIHALNERLTRSIPRDNKYNIYIAPHAQLHMDSQNPISMTDIRLIRRLVRDYNYRNSDAKTTLSFWPSVRKGEFRWIYPFQEGADYVFNSELTYELAVLKKQAMEILSHIDPDCKESIYANKLMNFLKYITEMNDKWIPCNSIIREFIGGSIFYED